MEQARENRALKERRVLVSAAAGGRIHRVQQCLHKSRLHSRKVQSAKGKTPPWNRNLAKGMFSARKGKIFYSLTQSAFVVKP